MKTNNDKVILEDEIRAICKRIINKFEEKKEILEVNEIPSEVWELATL